MIVQFKICYNASHVLLPNTQKNNSGPPYQLERKKSQIAQFNIRKKWVTVKYFEYNYNCVCTRRDKFVFFIQLGSLPRHYWRQSDARLSDVVSRAHASRTFNQYIFVSQGHATVSDYVSRQSALTWLRESTLNHYALHLQTNKVHQQGTIHVKVIVTTTSKC